MGGLSDCIVSCWDTPNGSITLWMSLGVETRSIQRLILLAVARCPLKGRHMTCGEGTQPSVLNALTTEEER